MTLTQILNPLLLQMLLISIHYLTGHLLIGRRLSFLNTPFPIQNTAHFAKLAFNRQELGIQRKSGIVYKGKLPAFAMVILRTTGTFFQYLYHVCGPRVLSKLFFNPSLQRTLIYGTNRSGHFRGRRKFSQMLVVIGPQGQAITGPFVPNFLRTDFK